MKAFRDTFEFILTDIEDLIQDPSRMKPHLNQFQTFLSVARLYTHRRIMRPDELSIVRRRSKRTSKDRSLFSMHNASCARLHT